MLASNAKRMRSPVWNSLAGSTSIGASFGPAWIIRKRMPGETLASSAENISLASRSRSRAGITRSRLPDVASGETLAGAGGLAADFVESGAAGDAVDSAGLLGGAALGAGAPATGPASRADTLAAGEGSSIDRDGAA